MEKQTEAPGDLELVRTFLNTIDIEDGTDELSDPRALASWLAAHGLAPEDVRANRADLARTIELREALREVLLDHNGRPPTGEPGEVLDAASCRARLRLRFDTGGDAHLIPQAVGVSGALGRLLAIVHAAIADGSWARMKACRSDTCQYAFYDHTKNRSGAWCSMETCGNRAKARAYRERQSAGA